MNDRTGGPSATCGRPRLQALPGAVEQPDGQLDSANESDPAEGSGDQQLLGTYIFSTMDDVVEALRAADTLGLGVRIHNCLVADDEPDTHYEQWVLELFAEARYGDE